MTTNKDTRSMSDREMLSELVETQREIAIKLFDGRIIKKNLNDIVMDPAFTRLGNRDLCVINQMPHKLPIRKHNELYEILCKLSALAISLNEDIRHEESDTEDVDVIIPTVWMSKWNDLDACVSKIHNILISCPVIDTYHSQHR